jgi:hypothetical protein
MPAKPKSRAELSAHLTARLNQLEQGRKVNLGGRAYECAIPHTAGGEHSVWRCEELAGADPAAFELTAAQLGHELMAAGVTPSKLPYPQAKRASSGHGGHRPRLTPLEKARNTMLKGRRALLRSAQQAEATLTKAQNDLAELDAALDRVDPDWRKTGEAGDDE